MNIKYRDGLLLTVPCVFVAIGLIIVIAGLYIRHSKNIYIINQVSRKKRYNVDGFADFAGKQTVFMGSIVIFIGFVHFITAMLTGGYSLFIVFLAAYLITLIYFSFKITNGIKKFEID